MLESIENAPFHCKQCSHRAVWPFQMDSHVQRNHGNVYATQLFQCETEPEQYSCICCHSQSYYKLNQYEHYTREHDATMIEDENIDNKELKKVMERYSCGNHCEYKSHSSLSLVKHSCQTMTKNAELPVSTLRTKLSTQFDSTCKKGAAEANRITDVQQAPADGMNMLSCSKCSCQFKLKTQLIKHMSIHVSDDNVKWFKCTKCSYQAKAKYLLTCHLLTHASNGDGWFKCTMCTYRSNRNSNLNGHMLTHAPDAEIVWFNCTKCRFRSKHKASIEIHTASHSECDADWFRCTKCSFRAKTKWRLHSHRLTHTTSADWFECPDCSYRSNSKRYLKRHSLVHASDDKIAWFSCTKCPYRAKRRRNLKSHMESHGDDWFECSICSFRTLSKKYFPRHMLTHDTRTFQCDKCSYRTKDKRLVKSHVQLHSALEDVKWHDRPLHNFLN